MDVGSYPSINGKESPLYLRVAMYEVFLPVSSTSSYF